MPLSSLEMTERPRLGPVCTQVERIVDNALSEVYAHVTARRGEGQPSPHTRDTGYDAVRDARDGACNAHATVLRLQAHLLSIKSILEASRSHSSAPNRAAADGDRAFTEIPGPETSEVQEDAQAAAQGDAPPPGTSVDGARGAIAAREAGRASRRESWEGSCSSLDTQPSQLQEELAATLERMAVLKEDVDRRYETAVSPSSSQSGSEPRASGPGRGLPVITRLDLGKVHAAANATPWDESTGHPSAQDAYRRAISPSRHGTAEVIDMGESRRTQMNLIEATLSQKSSRTEDDVGAAKPAWIVQMGPSIHQQAERSAPEMPAADKHYGQANKSPGTQARGKPALVLAEALSSDAMQKWHSIFRHRTRPQHPDSMRIALLPAMEPLEMPTAVVNVQREQKRCERTLHGARPQGVFALNQRRATRLDQIEAPQALRSAPGPRAVNDESRHVLLQETRAAQERVQEQLSIFYGKSAEKRRIEGSRPESTQAGNGTNTGWTYSAPGASESMAYGAKRLDSGYTAVSTYSDYTTISAGKDGASRQRTPNDAMNNARQPRSERASAAHYSGYSNAHLHGNHQASRHVSSRPSSTDSSASQPSPRAADAVGYNYGLPPPPSQRGRAASTSHQTAVPSSGSRPHMSSLYMRQRAPTRSPSPSQHHHYHAVHNNHVPISTPNRSEMSPYAFKAQRFFSPHAWH